MQLVSGQKIALNQLIQNDKKFTLRVQFKASFDVDISSFGVGGFVAQRFEMQSAPN